MRHPSFPVHSAAAVFNASTVMFPRSTYRSGGRTRWGRSFSQSPLAGNHQPVSGDSHFDDVGVTNSRLQQRGGSSSSGKYHADPNFAGYGGSGYQPPLYSYRPKPRLPPSSSTSCHPQYNPNQHRPMFDVNHGFRPPPPRQQPQPWSPRPKPLDYREWEYARQMPPPGCEKLLVLSYNILADYLANNHWSKLYYHIPRRFLDWEWRKRSIVFELGLWSPDIMCFQEVDKFNDLEIELKPHGYIGIWKMRTGIARDGCAIFWRESKFKLVHEECIEFNRLGLRDNVAQICVLETLIQHAIRNHSNPSMSSSCPTRVVICNIHVLYNPKRGEIKLGQVRELLDRAHTVSKIWSDAPVVICGDFNCTPKSPLYTFISEQKLDLSLLDRDKVSGQASAEIQNGRKQYNPHPGLQSSKDESPTSSINENQNLMSELNNSFSDMRINNPEPESNLKILTPPVMSGMGGNNWNQASDGTGSADASVENLKINHDTHPAAKMASVDPVVNKTETIQSAELDQPLTPTEEKIRSGIIKRDIGFKADLISDQDIGLCSPSSYSDGYSESISCSVPGLPSKDYDCCRKDVGDETNLNVSNLDKAIDLDASQGRTICVEEKLWGVLDETDRTSQVDANLDEGFKSFLGQLHNSEASPDIEILQDLPTSMDAASVAGNINSYNPSLWTPMEIATATGNENCTIVNHSLKLQSTYVEVEDFSRTRDSNGEPIVTSYNRCFFGTVDYIWRSEGLQTIRVLAPIPEQAMKWTPGFPTKKWGSDHIALVVELAFIKDAASTKETEVS